MTLTNKEKIRHKNQLFRILSEILDDEYLSHNLYFKGGTCANMLGFLDRFSVDLDFDTSSNIDVKKAKKRLHGIFDALDLKIDDESQRALQFFLKYDAPQGERNTIKIEAVGERYKDNDYNSFYISSIERTAVCQTIETMFANKLVAPVDRYERSKKDDRIAGRDIYDIHHFFEKGFDYKKGVIEERRRESVKEYFKELIDFIETKVTQRAIDQDLNILLENKKFQKVRKHLKKETIRYLKEEIN